MRLSTAIILSILSANVFAIEHPNGAHSGSLLARRAVVTDTDDVFLQKRTNDKEPEEQDKPNTSVPNPGQEKHVHTKDLSGDDFDSDPSSSDGAEGSSTDFPDYVHDQDDEDQGARNNVYTGLGSNQRRLSFADASGDSSSRVLGGMMQRLSPAKLRLILLLSKHRASTASDRVKLHFNGKEGDKIRADVYRLLSHALKSSMHYKGLYLNPVKTPFSLKLLPFAIPDKLKKIYKDLQNEVLGYIKNHILTIETAIETIITAPKSVVSILETIVKTAEDFYMSISNAKTKYFSLLRKLGVSDDMYSTDLDHHMNLLEAYKTNLSEQCDIIEDMVENYRKNPKQQGSSSALESKERSEIETKPSDDVTSSNLPSEDGVVYDLVSVD
ncbi:hypothetical protein BASA61_001977 [Batrachochytrium salamandrivorans]|nr:hypothetical protein BASA61_001977 [Batrachochytrium salamandrivorans]KAH9269817.1 hypothetical protein BASA83_008134 [Batrachochytrium salamandrivorans]